MMDSYLDSYATPLPDAKQSIQNISAAANNGLISFLFSRAVETGDTTHDIAFTECLYLIYPVGGGAVDIQRRNIRKHQQTPLISDEQICLTSCASANNKEAPAAVQPAVKPESPAVKNQTEPKAIAPGAPAVPQAGSPQEIHKNAEGHAVPDQINKPASSGNHNQASEAPVAAGQNPTTLATPKPSRDDEIEPIANCKGEWKVSECKR